MVDEVWEPIRDLEVAYFDDILIGTKAEKRVDLLEEQDRDVRRVMEVLKEKRLVVDNKI